jgi:hypothetical protein
MSKVRVSSLHEGVIAHTNYQDFGPAGLRLGSLITQNAELKKAAAANVRFHNLSGMSTTVGTAI